MAISKIKLPNNLSQELHDYRISGVDSSPSSGSGNVVTSGGVYTALEGKASLNTPVFNEYIGVTNTSGNTTSTAMLAPLGIVYAPDTSSGSNPIELAFPSTSGYLALQSDIPSASSTTPSMDGTAAVGSGTTWARADHVHPSDTSKQDTLVSGTNIKTINNESILGSGNITISGGGGGITGITMNNSSVTITNGVADLGTVITSHQDISGKANSADLATVATSGNYNDLSNKPSIKNISWVNYGDSEMDEIMYPYENGYLVACYYKPSGSTFSRVFILTRMFVTTENSVDYNNAEFTCVNNDNTISTILCKQDSDEQTSTVWGGLTTITLESTSNKVTSLSASSTDTQYPSAKATYDTIHPEVVTSQPAGGMAPNIVYELGTLSGNTTFTLASPADADIANHYFWTFTTPSTAPTITWPAGITSWYGGAAPEIAASKHYEVSVLDGVGICMEV